MKSLMRNVMAVLLLVVTAGIGTAIACVSTADALPVPVATALAPIGTAETAGDGRILTTAHSIYRDLAGGSGLVVDNDENVDIPIPNRNEAFEIYTTTGSLAGFEFYRGPEITNSVPESRFVGFGNLIQQTTQNPEISTLAPSLFGFRIIRPLEFIPIRNPIHQGTLYGAIANSSELGSLSIGTGIENRPLHSTAS